MADVIHQRPSGPRACQGSPHYWWNACSEVHAEILQMADMPSAGIIRQFPAKSAR